MLGPRRKPIHSSCWQVAFASQCSGREEEQLNRECSIARRLLSTHAVRMNLLINLQEQRTPTILAQYDCAGKSRSHGNRLIQSACAKKKRSAAVRVTLSRQSTPMMESATATEMIRSASSMPEI